MAGKTSKVKTNTELLLEYHTEKLNLQDRLRTTHEELTSTRESAEKAEGRQARNLYNRCSEIHRRFRYILSQFRNIERKISDLGKEEQEKKTEEARAYWVEQEKFAEKVRETLEKK